MSDNTLVSSTTENVIYPTERAGQEAEQRQEVTAQAANPYVKLTEEKTLESAADVKAKGSQIASQGGGALDEFEEAMSAKTGQAVTEGKHDVDEAKTSGAVYIQQAKQTAADVANAAQEYVSVGIDEHTPVDPNAPQDTGLVSSLQSVASTAYEKGKIYLAAAQETAEPHVRKVQETVQPHAENLIEAAKPYVNKAQSALSSALGNPSTVQNGDDDTPKV